MKGKAVTYYVNIYVRNGKAEPGLEHDTRLEAIESAAAALVIANIKYNGDTTLNSRVRVTLK